MTGERVGIKEGNRETERANGMLGCSRFENHQNPIYSGNIQYVGV
jgi:hypothetical protein